MFLSPDSLNNRHLKISLSCSRQTNVKQSSVTNEGTLLEYETLQLRVTPPNVVIDNESYDDRTLVTVDSANRPGLIVGNSIMYVSLCSTL